MRTRMGRSYCLLFALLHVGASACFGQVGDSRIQSVTFTYLPPDRYVDVRFTARLDRDNPQNFEASNVTVTALPATPLNVTDMARLPGSARALRLHYEGDPPADATDVEVCFVQLFFLDASGKPEAVTQKTCGRGAIPRDFAAERDRQLKKLQEVAKTSSEKNVFASGFVTTAKGGSEGGADIVLNSKDIGIPNLHSFLHLKKATLKEADPKHFEAGASFRKAFLTGVATREDLASQLAVARSDPDPAKRLAARKKINELQEKLQSGWFAGALFDFAGKLEGEAGDFNVTNFVGETAVQFQSMTKRLGRSRKGFWRFRLMPAAMEGGQSLGTGDESAAVGDSPQAKALRDVEWIARLKSGGSLTFFYDDPQTTGPFKRVELDMNVVNRHLFFKEVMFNDETKTTDITKKGSRAYFQADLKVYVGESASGRYGVKLSYNRGSLPPVFAKVKSFQFGFLFESSEGEGVSGR